MNPIAKRWAWLGGTVIVCFTILGFFGREVYRQAPPIPERVVSRSGTLLMTQRSEERRVGKECRSRVGPVH